MKVVFPPDNPSEAGPWRNSRLYESLPVVFPVFTYVLVLWCCVVQVLIYSVRAEDIDVAVSMMNKVGGPILADPYAEPMWKFLTSCFVHDPGFLMHLVFNMMWLVQLGSLMERGLGTLKTVLFVVAVGFVSSAVASSITGNPGIGLSGVVYGFCGFMWTAWPRWTGFLEKFRGQTVKFMLFWQVICFVLTYTGSYSVGNFAHISGMVYGALLGKWACLGSKHGQRWMWASVAFTLLGAVCACRPMSAWF